LATRITNSKKLRRSVIVVSNTSPITSLAAIGYLNLLHDIYGTIIIPVAVYEEMTGLGYSVPGTI
jgi:predicted nucleic acid-binding protein